MKGMSKGIGPKRLGSPNKMGHMGKSAAKIMKKTKLEKQANRVNRRIDRDKALADINPERALRRAERLKKKAANMPQAKPYTRRNERLSNKRQERLVRAGNIEHFFVPYSKKNK